MKSSYDVCLVGLGVVGSMLARDLTRAGMEVVALERGPYRKPEEANDHDEIRHISRNILFHPLSDVPYTYRRNDREQATLLGHQNRGAGTGGASVVYSAWMWRYLPDDFRSRSTTIERYGEDALPAESTLADWPIGYDEIEPFYEQAEDELGICGDAGVLRDSSAPNGQRHTGRGNPFEAPRRAEFPLPVPPGQGGALLVAEAAKGLGYHPYPTGGGILSKDYRGRKACTYCGTCTMFGCPVGAKASTNVTHLPEAERTGRLTIRTECTVFQLTTDSTGKRVESARFYNQEGGVEEVRAGLFVIGAFTFETPRLLFLSADDHFPNGLANSSGEVGRHHMGLGGVRSYALYDDIDLAPYVGPVSCHRSMDDLNGDNFDHEGLGFVRGANICTAAHSGSSPLNFMNTPPDDVGTWGRGFKEYVKRYYRSHIVINAVSECLPYSFNTVDLDPSLKDKFGHPALRITFEFGPNEEAMNRYMAPRCEEILNATGAVRVFTKWAPATFRTNALGTTRMGDDPATSVVDSYGQSHDLPNLFIGGASIFPSAGSRVPTLTIAALCLRTGERIVSGSEAGGDLVQFL